MSSGDLERGRQASVSELVRLDKYGIGLGGALSNAILTEHQLGPMTSPRLSQATIGKIVDARERLVDQVEIARKSGDPTRASLAEKAVEEYAAVFDMQADKLNPKPN